MKKHIAEPLKNKKDIQVVEKYLKERNKRDYVIWVLGLNSGLRVSDIVAPNVSICSLIFLTIYFNIKTR